MHKAASYIISVLIMVVMFFVISDKAYASSSSSRISGTDRFQTAVSISREGWPDGSNYVILATSEDYPDALSAAPLAAKYKAPILLTGYDSVNTDTAAELRRLKAKQVIIIGGTGVISENVENTLKNVMGYNVLRIAGSDRYETAVKIAEKIGNFKSIAVVTGNDFTDAVSIAPIAANMGMPILLVSNEDMTQPVKNFLKNKKIYKTYVIGNYDDISQSVESGFQNVVRISGEDRFSRNINVLKAFCDSIDFETVYVATGYDYPDALTASVLAAKESHAVILTDYSISHCIRDFVRSKVIRNIYVLGGYSAVNSYTESALRDLPSSINSIEPVNVTINEKENYTPPKTVTAKLSNGIKCETSVSWNINIVDTNRPGLYIYTGSVKGYGGYAYLYLTIKPSIAEVYNISSDVVQNNLFIFPQYASVRYTDNTMGRYPIKWELESVSLNKTGTYKYSGKLDGTDKTISLTLNVVEDSEVVIKDNTLKSILCNALQKSINSSIYRSDLLSLISIHSYGSGTITTLEGLKYATNLTELYLENYSIQNISELKYLTKLEKLDLSRNQISDITPLQKMINLNYLDLRYNNITDIKALKNLLSLRSLYLRGNFNNGVYLTDFSPTRNYYRNLGNNKDFVYENN